MSAFALQPQQDTCDPEPEALRSAFGEALARLPGPQARALRLRDVEGHAPERICEQLGVSEEALAELLYEARLAMCRALAPLG
jgi:DNA-directed RNA polymerase specialized sigma24 family protein